MLLLSSELGYIILLELMELTVPGSRQLSIASVHSSATSLRSYSAKRYEREHEMRMAAQAAKQRETASVSPSPHSTDQLLGPMTSESETQVLCGMFILFIFFK